MHSGEIGTNSRTGGPTHNHGRSLLRKLGLLLLYPQALRMKLNDRRIGLARAETAWRSMITNALARHIKVILLTPTPDTASKLDDPNDPLNLHAALVRRLAAEYHVALADSLAAFNGEIAKGAQLKDLMSQSNHPNRRGHELVARELSRLFAGESQSPP